MSASLGRIGVVGAGAVAHALAAGLDPRRVLVWARRRGSAEALAASAGRHVRVAGSTKELVAHSDVILIAVSDRAIPEVAEGLLSAGLGASHDAVVLHTSGATTGAGSMPSLVGQPRITVGSMHPLSAVAAGRSDTLKAMPFALEGASERAGEIALEVSSALGGIPLGLPLDTALSAEDVKARYHAMATMVATGAVALIERAAVVTAAGGDPAPFREAFAALARSAVNNAAGAPGARVLTGPVARGDEGTLQRHRDVLTRHGAAAALHQAVVEAARAMLAEPPFEPVAEETHPADGGAPDEPRGFGAGVHP